MKNFIELFAIYFSAQISVGEQIWPIFVLRDTLINNLVNPLILRPRPECPFQVAMNLVLSVVYHRLLYALD